jgi:pyruvate dehydrogenase E2 component (dihydrolipoamide acetyltransferase)
MPFSVVMPALEMAQETGKLVSWRKKEGESVSKGEPLLEVETDKAVLEVECPADGILAGISAHEGAVIPVGRTIAWIVGPGEIPPPEAAPGIASAPASIDRTASAAPNARASTNAAGARISPKARRLAKERGADLGRLRGSGPDGEILASDVLAAAESPGKAAPPPLETLSSIGRLMAERTTQSWTSVPHFFVVRELDASFLLAARERLGPAIEMARGVRITHTDLLVVFVAHALTKHPRMNASWSEEGIRLNPDINVSIAMAVNDGVVAAVIQQANTKKLGEIAIERRDLSERAHSGRLRPPDIAGATFTISNLGMYQVDAFSAIISPPQAAILAVGRIADRIVPVDGQPAIRPMMTVTLSCDHRVVDGVRAAAFLNDLAEAIRQPDEWLQR